MGRGVKEGTGHTRGVWQRSKGNGMVNTEVSGSKTFVVGQEKRASTKPKKEPVDERPEAPDRAAASVGFPITWKARESLCPGEGATLRKIRVPSRAPAVPVPGRLPLPHHTAHTTSTWRRGPRRPLELESLSARELTAKIFPSFEAWPQCHSLREELPE